MAFEFKKQIFGILSIILGVINIIYIIGITQAYFSSSFINPFSFIAIFSFLGVIFSIIQFKRHKGVVAIIGFILNILPAVLALAVIVLFSGGGYIGAG